MAKTKPRSAENVKASLKDKVSKRKSIKKSAAKTPKLQLQATAVKKALKPGKSPENGKPFVIKSEIISPKVKLDSPPSRKSFVLAPANPIDSNQIREGVRALFQYIEVTAAKKTLFEDEEPIFLQITGIKVPNTPNRQIRFTLKHSLLPAESDICLIVRDIGKPKEHEETIEHFEEILNFKGITNIKTIMPYHQFKTEYGNQYELKRKLLGLYDHFLVDGRISGYVVHLLGKIFYEKRKMPVPIDMEKYHLKEAFDRALRKTAMKIHSKSDSFMVQVGHAKMSQDEVFENIVGVVDEMSEEFPGGLDNVRALGIKTSSGLLIPVYLTLKSKNTQKVPLQIPKRPKAHKEFIGELTTFLNKEVTVLPSGEVIVRDTPLSDDEEATSGDENFLFKSDDETVDEFLTNGDAEDEEETEVTQDAKEDNAEAEDDEEEKKDVLAQAEELYLNVYEQEKINTRKTKKNKPKDDEASPKKNKKGKPAKTIKKPVKKQKVAQQTNGDTNNLAQVASPKQRKTKKQKGMPMQQVNIDEAGKIEQVTSRKDRKAKKSAKIEETNTVVQIKTKGKAGKANKQKDIIKVKIQNNDKVVAQVEEQTNKKNSKKTKAAEAANQPASTSKKALKKKAQMNKQPEETQNAPIPKKKRKLPQAQDNTESSPSKISKSNKITNQDSPKNKKGPDSSGDKTPKSRKKSINAKQISFKTKGKKGSKH